MTGCHPPVGDIYTVPDGKQLRITDLGATLTFDNTNDNRQRGAQFQLSTSGSILMPTPSTMTLKTPVVVGGGTTLTLASISDPVGGDTLRQRPRLVLRGP